jgi:hypothetical protein
MLTKYCYSPLLFLNMLMLLVATYPATGGANTAQKITDEKLVLPQGIDVGNGSNSPEVDVLVTDGSQSSDSSPVIVPIPSSVDGEIEVIASQKWERPEDRRYDQELDKNDVRAFQCEVTPTGYVKRRSCQAVSSFPVSTESEPSSHAFVPGFYLLQYRNSESSTLIEVKPGQKTVIRLGRLVVQAQKGRSVSLTAFRDFTQYFERLKAWRTLYGVGPDFLVQSEYPWSREVMNGPSADATESECLDPDFVSKLEDRVPIARKMCEAYLAKDPYTLAGWVQFTQDGSIITRHLQSYGYWGKNWRTSLDPLGCLFGCNEWYVPQGGGTMFGSNAPIRINVLGNSRSAGGEHYNNWSKDVVLSVFPGSYGMEIEVRDQNGVIRHQELKLGIHVR